MSKKSELQRKKFLRLSNEESNRFTKECIETALLVLLEEKDFRAISITDIVNRAGVSRSAYYRNYSSKEDILNNYLNTVVQTITDSLDMHKDYYKDLNFWISVFERVRTYSDQFATLLKAGFDSVILSSVNKTMLDSLLKEDNIFSDRYEVFFWNGALYNLLREWVNSGMKESDRGMAIICRNISSNFLCHHRSDQVFDA